MIVMPNLWQTFIVQTNPDNYCHEKTLDSFLEEANLLLQCIVGNGSLSPVYSLLYTWSCYRKGPGGSGRKSNLEGMPLAEAIGKNMDC